jgi:hypothetical protein
MARSAHIMMLCWGHHRVTRSLARGEASWPAGISANLAKPGGNIAGPSTQFKVLLLKVIEILHEIVPGAERIAVVRDAASAFHPRRSCFCADQVIE